MRIYRIFHLRLAYGRGPVGTWTFGGTSYETGVCPVLLSLSVEQDVSLLVPLSLYRAGRV